MTPGPFKAYDIRGRVPDELNAELARRIGHAFVATQQARTVLIGHDVRLESPELSKALARGLMEAGADVIDIGLCGTEEVYFGTVHHGTDDVQATIDRILATYGGGENDHTDGVSVEFPDWRFNLRGSNTEPVLRLNVETRADAALLDRRVAELSALVKQGKAMDARG